ncbi:hypothetical protein M1771_07700 [Spiroplasma citri]|uniref:hypothetical protein n=1 Tax=Spiroplasma citri TaxID=2133 RepID=UPI002412BB19|nr:hypothetical protein [Spiroplasma citri]WFG99874.1 hypothetical protein M1771_07700 [Spiroplasma citri]
MKKLQDLIKDLTDITVEEQKINDYLENESIRFTRCWFTICLFTRYWFIFC